MRDWVRAHEFWAIPCVIVVVFAVLVFLAFGRSHTKTVTETKTVTKTVTKTSKARFDGSLSSLVGFLHPSTASQTKCPPGVPPQTVCFNFGSQKWYVFFAAPASAAAQ